jgi:FHA domain-containing protein/type VI secretion system protein
MLLILRVQSYRNQTVGAGFAHSFSAAGGTLGRSADSDLVLDDPGKYISRTHASVRLRDGAFYLADAGSNPSIVNDRPLGKGRDIALGDGDRIVIGDYLLISELQEELVAAPPAPPPAPEPQVEAPPPLPLFVPPPVVAPAPLPPFPPLMAPVPAPARAEFAASLPDALAGARILDGASGIDAGDALADPLGLNLFAPSGVRGPDAAALAPAFRGAESDHLSPEFQALALPAVPAVPAMQAAPPAVSPFAIPADYDPLADFLPPRAVAAPFSAPAAAPLSVPAPAPASPAPLTQAAPAVPAVDDFAPAPPHDATPPPVLAAAAPAMAPLPAPAPSAAAPAAGESAVLQALLNGLGLPQLRSQRSPEQLAQLVGEMLRAATGGTMEVLMARALTKRESNIDMTMIAPRSNNPLKFFPDADSALTQMLSAETAGYLPPVRAIGGAFDDLKAHELAVIAGMRAALAAVVQRFDPARIEQRVAEPGKLDKLLPSGRKARMWDRLVELYGELARDADEDLQRLFGEKFSVAYEEQVTRLRGGR